MNVWLIIGVIVVVILLAVGITWFGIFCRDREIAQQAHELFERIHQWTPAGYKKISIPHELTDDYHALAKLIHSHSDLLWAYNIDRLALDRAMGAALQRLLQRCKADLTGNVSNSVSTLAVLKFMKSSWNNLGFTFTEEELQDWLLRGVRIYMDDQRQSLAVFYLLHQRHLQNLLDTPPAQLAQAKIHNLIAELQELEQLYFQPEMAKANPAEQVSDLPSLMPEEAKDPAKVSTGEDDGIWPKELSSPPADAQDEYLEPLAWKDLSPTENEVLSAVKPGIE